MDNWFQSRELAEELIKRGYTVLGTLRKGKRGQPCSATLSFDAKEKRGTCKTFKHDTLDLWITVWRDKKDVRFMHSVACPMGQCERKIKATATSGFRTILVPRPCIASFYNYTMNGPDRNDQLTKYIRFTLRCRRPTRNLLFHLAQITAVNAMIIHGALNNKRHPIKRFCVNCCELVVLFLFYCC